MIESQTSADPNTPDSRNTPQVAVANYPAPRCDGRSFAVDPLGNILAMADDRAGLTLVEFDFELIRRTRREDWFRWRSEP
jgi:predicted amidohydrolase